MSSFPVLPALSRLRRGALALTAAALLTTACASSATVGGPTSETGQGDRTTATAQSGDVDQTDDRTGNGASSTADPAGGGEVSASTSNPSALPTTPIPAADIRVFRPNETVLQLVPFTPVVNTCDSLSGAALSDIVAQLSTEYSFGEGATFPDGELLGAACVYRSDTHGVGIIIGSADELGADAADAVTPIASGDVTGSPWQTDAAVTILSEDSFGLNTPFAAHASADGFGVIAYNASGTGIDYGSTGELFARMAAAAAASAASAGPVVDIDPSANIQTARPCDLFDSAELSGFLGTPLANAEAVDSSGTTCEWGLFEVQPGATVRIRIHHANDASSEFAGLAPTGTASVQVNEAGKPFVVTDTAIIDVLLSVVTEEGNNDVDFNYDAAELETLENIASRIVP